MSTNVRSQFTKLNHFQNKWGSILFFAISSVLLRAYVPIVPYYTAAHDDLLMVTMANNIRSGEWLGTYSDLTHRTFSKGSGYPLFLAITHIFPWSPAVTVHILLLVGAALCLAQLVNLGLQRKMFAPSFALIAFFPVWFGDSMSRVYRDGLLTALLFLSIGVVFLLVSKIRNVYLAEKSTFRWSGLFLVIGATFGFLLSISFVTKSTIIPLVLLAVLVSTQVAIRYRNKRVYLGLSMFALSAVLAFQPTVIYIKNANSKTYGLAVVENYYSGPFAESLKSMSAVSPISQRRYVAVTKYARQNMYAASPTMRKLQPWLEGKPGEGWKAASCASPTKICDESGAWFPWELRDAVEHAGLGDTAVSFNSTFESIFSELRSACKSKQLRCERSSIVPGLPQISNIPIRDVIESTSETFLSIWNLRSAEKGSNSYYENLDKGILDIWNNTVKGLPPNLPLESYKPMQNFGVSSIQLLSSIYAMIWRVLMIGMLVTMIWRFRLFITSRNALNLVFSSLLLPTLLSVLTISILEAGLGGYLSMGGNLYTLSIYPFIFLLCALSLSSLIESINATQKDKN